MGQQKKPPEREQVGIRIPHDLYMRMKKYALKKGYTVNDVILFALWNHIEHQNL